MAEAPRPKPVEYYNPRGLLLGICFIWGIAVGFFLFYLTPPKVIPAPTAAQPADDNEPRPLPVSNRLENVPAVEPVPQALPPARPRLETMVLESPPPILTPEGGLTGHTAQPLTPRASPGAPDPNGRSGSGVQPMLMPPPIPDLMP